MGCCDEQRSLKSAGGGVSKIIDIDSRCGAPCKFPISEQIFVARVPFFISNEGSFSKPWTHDTLSCMFHYTCDSFGNRVGVFHSVFSCHWKEPFFCTSSFAQPVLNLRLL